VTTEDLPTRFDPASIEARLYSLWLERGTFHVPASAVLEHGREPYVIVMPPPNVTDVLHMGHGLNNTIQDVLIRWRRMQGRAAEWMPGTDHAGIATQNVVERRIAKEGLTRTDLGREAFVARVWDFVNATGGAILDQLKTIGCSCDWERTRFTLDPGLSRAVREVFVRLYEKGLIYRGEYIINWCPRCLTALSTEEAEGVETEGKLYHLRYPFDDASQGAAEAASKAGAAAIGRLADGRWYLTVSTTRPETMLGDTGVAVSPEDPRYRGLIGAEVDLPLTGRRIPVVADSGVDPEFGTGMVKVTPAHDPNDFEIAARTGLPLLDVMNPDATMNERAPAEFRGKDRFEVRKAVLDALEHRELRGDDVAHTHSVPQCYRCHTVVEPRLSLQWFVKMKPLAEPALAASRDGTITFTPERHRKVYEHWMENIRDWCISRQLWWGHRIPVWYCRTCGKMTVPRQDPDACSHCGSKEIEQDPDVLDTWFSSWLWPFSTFGWPEQTEELKAFYPTHTLSTAPEILFFWVARMIMAGYEFMGRAPFTQVYLHATVRDKYGRKMSKSLGNGIDPREVVKRYGADALRWTVLSSAAVGTDFNLDHEDLEVAFSPGRNFSNKVWNAGRFTLMSVGEGPVSAFTEFEAHLELADRWILSRLQQAIEDVTRGLERFRLHEVAENLRTFFWGDLADWYLELVKTRLWGEEGEASRQAARSTLLHVLDGSLRLLHPLIPFVTSALWEQLPGAGEQEGGLVEASWPEPDPRLRDPESEARVRAMQELITTVRSLRKEYGVPEGGEITIQLATDQARVRETVEAQGPALLRLARVREVRWGKAEKGSIGAHGVMTDGTELFVPLEGVIDLARERERLTQEITRLEGQVRGGEGKLANEQFVQKAKPEVVEREREKVRTQKEQLAKLAEKLALFKGLS
jgi:valyl-tRNA synthetase